jgi:hypothetical protein
MIALFAISLTVILMFVGLVIDGGNALVQRRESQNASDFAALAGARVIAIKVSGDTNNGTDANVRDAITKSIAVNQGAVIAFGAPNGPRYVNANGTALTYVGASAIPATAVGVTVDSGRSWRPFFLGIVGINSWTASAQATARGGYAAGGPGGNVFPAGIAQAFFDARQPCAGPVSAIPSDPCYPQQLTPGSLNVPGGFGWLKYGCSGYGLGQVSPANNGGCQSNAVFLQDELDPNQDAYGCCSQVGVSGLDHIGNLPGNKVSADCSYYINNAVVVTIPVWDYAGGTGTNAWYHIVGFTGFQITGCTGGKNLTGVWRVPMFNGPTTSTPGFAGAPLAVQLIH